MEEKKRCSIRSDSGATSRTLSKVGSFGQRKKLEKAKVRSSVKVTGAIPESSFLWIRKSHWNHSETLPRDVKLDYCNESKYENMTGVME